MGYYTHYKIAALDLQGRETEEDIQDLLAAALGRSNFDHEVQKSLIFEFNLIKDGETSKWYDWKRDMLALSVAIPDRIFHVEGEGQENGDMWTHWFCAGKQQGDHVKIIRPELDLTAWEKQP